MPIHPTVLFILKFLKSQLRFTYMFIPIAIYVILLIIYPIIQKQITGPNQIICNQKTLLVELDEYIFESFYTIVRKSLNQVLIILCAIPYLVHFTLPLFYMIYLIIQRPGWSYFWLYVLSLGISSSITILIQYIYPTAPPWLFSDLPPEAKFYKVDEILSTKLFHGIYGLNKIICGAFPSMHVEWPSIIALNGVVSPYFGITYVLWIMTAAIYSDHHWISDVLIGLCIAVLSVWLSKLYVKDIIFEVKIIDTSSETNPQLFPSSVQPDFHENSKV